MRNLISNQKSLGEKPRVNVNFDFKFSRQTENNKMTNNLKITIETIYEFHKQKLKEFLKSGNYKAAEYSFKQCILCLEQL
jgi:hypothetical protein